MSKESLKKISVEVMNNMAENYLKIWSCYGPFTLNEKTDENISYKDSSGVLVSFSRPYHIENWTENEGYGKALKYLINDPGMHNKAMWVFGTKELAGLITYRLSDCSGNPTDLGKKVYEAMVN